MRFVVASLLSVVLFGCAGPQRTQEGVPDGANDQAAESGTSTIMITSEAHPDSAYITAARLLQERGYGIKNSDSDLKTLSSTWRSLDEKMGPAVSTQIYIGVVDSSPTDLQLSGVFRTSTYDEQSIKKQGQSGSATRRAWAELFSIAHLLSQKLEAEIVFDD